MSEIRYVTLTEDAKPILLARVRWPDVAEGITLGRSEWQTDPGLFDLPYDPSGVEVTHDQAEEIAAEWGVGLGDERPSGSTASLIRRMPSSWSHLTSAERKAWSVELSRIRRSNRHRHARRGSKKIRGHVRVLRTIFRRSPSNAGLSVREDGPKAVVLTAKDPFEKPVFAETSRNLSDPRLTGLRLPVTSAQSAPAGGPNPTSEGRLRPGVR